MWENGPWATERVLDLFEMLFMVRSSLFPNVHWLVPRVHTGQREVFVTNRFFFWYLDVEGICLTHAGCMAFLVLSLPLTCWQFWSQCLFEKINFNSYQSNFYFTLQTNCASIGMLEQILIWILELPRPSHLRTLSLVPWWSAMRLGSSIMDLIVIGRWWAALLCAVLLALQE